MLETVKHEVRYLRQRRRPPPQVLRRCAPEHLTTQTARSLLRISCVSQTPLGAPTARGTLRSSLSIISGQSTIRSVPKERVLTSFSLSRRRFRPSSSSSLILRSNCASRSRPTTGWGDGETLWPAPSRFIMDWADGVTEVDDAIARCA